MEQAQTQAAKKTAPLTTAQKIAALEEKKQRLIEKSRREETKKKIILGAATAAMLTTLLNQRPQTANDMIKTLHDYFIAEKDKSIFEAMIAEIREKAAKKKTHAQAQAPQAQAG